MKSKLIGRLLSLSLSAVLAVSTFSVPAFAAENDIELTEEVIVTEEDTAEFTDEEQVQSFDEELFLENEQNTFEDEEVFFEEELTEETEEATEDAEDISGNDSSDDTTDEDVSGNDAPAEDVSGNDAPSEEGNEEDTPSEDISGNDAPSEEDISGNDSPSEDISGNDISGDDSDTKKEYSISYEFTVDGQAASDEVLATIYNPNSLESYVNEGYSFSYDLYDPETTSDLQFLGWYKNGNKLESSYYYDEEYEESVRHWFAYIYSTDKDVTFTGKFASTKTVTLDNNRDYENDTTEYTVITGKTINPEAPRRAGYFFKGWFTEKENGQKVDFSKLPITESKTYYAQWEAVTYTVKFHADNNSKDAVTKTYTIETAPSESMDLEVIFSDATKYADVLAKKDNFLGWSSANEFYSVQDYLGAMELMYSEAPTSTAMTVDMYAQWATDSYFVVFDAKGTSDITLENENFDASDFRVDSVKDLQQTKVFYVGEDVILTGREFVRDGYTLTGWKNSATGKTIAASGKLSNLAAKGETVTLTAQWKEETYTIEYDFNGGKSDKPKKVTYTRKDTPDWSPLYNYKKVTTVDEDDYTTSSMVVDNENPVVTKPGYTFNYWYNEKGYSQSGYAGYGDYENLKLKAYWSPVYYHADFDLNGGVSSNGWKGGLTTYYYGNKYSLKTMSSRLSRPGYTLTGWKYDSNENGVIDDNDKTIGVKGNVKNLTDKSGKTFKFQAQWKANKYSITYSNGKKAVQKDAVKKYTTGSEIKIAAPTRNGYTFNGYTVSAKDKKGYSAELVAVDENDLTKGYTLAAGSYGNIVLTANWLLTNPETASYKLQILPGAAGVTTTDGTAVSEDTGIFFNGGAEVSYTDTETAVTADFVRAGYVIKGFSYSKKGKVIDNATVGGHVAKDGVVKLYAVWTAKTDDNILATTARVDNKKELSIDVTAQVDGLKASKKTFTSGKDLKLPKLSVTGFKFLGWELTSGSADGLTKDKTGKYITKIGKNYSDDTLVLTPVLEAKTIKITFDPQGGNYKTTGSKKTVVYEAYYGENINFLIEELTPTTKKGNNLLRLAFDSKGSKYFTYSGSSAYYSSGYRVTKDTTIYAIWGKPVLKVPEKVSARLTNSNTLYISVKDKRLYDEVEAQYAIDSNFTQAVHTQDLGYAYYEGVEEGYYATGQRYYVRVRTYRYDSTGGKVYSDWSKTVMAVRNSVEAE
jgi:uncharacterized repeat protein (TIGR02543 family)